jgi:hypothetical protein
VFFSFREALAQTRAFEEDNALIMEMVLQDGAPVAAAADVYRVGQKWFIPLSSLMDGLSVAIQVSAALGKAEGSFIEESRQFKLDIQLCEVFTQGVKENYPCGDAQVFNDEIFVDSTLLEKWFSVRFHFDPFASKMSIDSSFQFPKQLRRERDKRTFIQPGSKAEQMPQGYYKEPIPDQKVGTLSFDQQLSISTLKQEGKDTTYPSRHDTFISTELFGFEAKTFIGGSERKTDEWSLSFSKKDPEGNLVGGAREIQAFDISVPSLPLVGTTGRARGLLISSFSLASSSSFTSRNFRGPLPSGWEVELYQNDVMVGRHSSQSASEYDFRDLPLYYGINYFRFVFYGPQGQRREEVEIVNIGQNLVRPQETRYRIAISDQADSGSQGPQSLMQIETGLNSNFSLGAVYIRQIPRKEIKPLNYGLLSLNGAYSRFLGSVNLISNDADGSAAEATLQIPFTRSSIGASQAVMSKFTSQLFQRQGENYLQQVTKLNVATSPDFFPALRLIAEVSENTFDGERKETQIAQRTSLQLGPLYVFNTLSATPEISSTPAGELLAIFVSGKYEIRPQVVYDWTIREDGLAVQYHLTNRDLIEASFRESRNDGVLNFELRATKLFEHITLTGEVGVDNRQNQRALALMSYGGIFDGHKGKMNFSPNPQTPYGAASAFVFLDKNYDGVFNEGDEPLKDITVLMNQSNQNFVTDENGRALITQMPVYQDIDVSISLRSLTDPYHHPLKKGVRLIPRPGVVAQIDFPVQVLSEVTGLVQIEKDGYLKGRRQIEVRLKKPTGEIIATAKTESDGFYFIDGVQPGLYVLDISPDQLIDLGLRAEPSSQDLNVLSTGINDQNVDFKLFRVSH